MRRRSSVELSNRKKSNESDPLHWVELIDKEEVGGCFYYIDKLVFNRFLATITF